MSCRYSTVVFIVSVSSLATDVVMCLVKWERECQFVIS